MVTIVCRFNPLDQYDTICFSHWIIYIILSEPEANLNVWYFMSQSCVAVSWLHILHPTGGGHRLPRKLQWTQLLPPELSEPWLFRRWKTGRPWCSSGGEVFDSSLAVDPEAPKWKRRCPKKTMEGWMLMSFQRWVWSSFPGTVYISTLHNWFELVLTSKLLSVTYSE